MKATSKRPVKSIVGPIGVLICAYNEANHIGHAINMIRNARPRGPIVVVDDGSSDGTGEIARRLGAVVIRLSKNRGKANAFFAGMRYMLRAGMAGAVSIDADLIKLSSSDLQRLIRTIIRWNRKKKLHMTVASHYEQYFSPTFQLSGTRGFTLGAMHHIVTSRHKRLAKGYGLETLLNNLFPDHHQENLEGYFLYKPAYRKGSDRQIEEVFSARARVLGLKRMRGFQDSTRSSRVSYRIRKMARKHLLGRRRGSV